MIGRLSAGPEQPDVDLRPEGVTVRLGTRGPGPTEGDLALARRISEATRDLGVGLDLGGAEGLPNHLEAEVRRARGLDASDPPKFE
jgi:hypothetical protein